MDVPSVPAWRDKHRLLRVECPFCHHDHYHFEWTKDDIHEAKCWPWDLPAICAASCYAIA